MNYRARWLASSLRRSIRKPYVHILFGARQTGKSTLLKAVLPDVSLRLDLSDPMERSRLLSRPESLIQECRALPKRRLPHVVLIDEAQAAPAVFDAVQHLYDNDRSRWRFVLCGSSARKLRSTGANLLPGRAMLHRLYPLTLCEHPATEAPRTAKAAIVPMELDSTESDRPFADSDLMHHLVWGELPGIVTAAAQDRADLLKAYTLIHLQEEIRREGMVRDWGLFVRFVQLAAAESGAIQNFNKLSNETGISAPTIKSHFQLLEDMFIGFTVPAFTNSPRKQLLSTPRFLFFDLGVRHAAANLELSPATVRADPGPAFQQWVGIELWKRLAYLGNGQLMHFRTAQGSEVDYVVRMRDRLIPIEVKWTHEPTRGDTRHLRAFVAEQGNRCPTAYIVCRCDRPRQLEDRVTAIPWWMI